MPNHLCFYIYKQIRWQYLYLKVNENIIKYE